LEAAGAPPVESAKRAAEAEAAVEGRDDGGDVGARDVRKRARLEAPAHGNAPSAPVSPDLLHAVAAPTVSTALSSQSPPPPHLPLFAQPPGAFMPMPMAWPWMAGGMGGPPAPYPWGWPFGFAPQWPMPMPWAPAPGDWGQAPYPDGNGMANGMGPPLVPQQPPYSDSDHPGGVGHS
jgi:hypothetical protein